MIDDILNNFMDNTDVWDEFMEGDDPEPEMYDKAIDNAYKTAKAQLLAEILKGAETYQDNHYDGSDTWEDYVEAIPVEYIEELFKKEEK